MDFEELYKKVTYVEPLEESIEKEIIKSFNNGDRCTDWFNPTDTKWDAVIIDKLERAGFKVKSESNRYNDTMYKISW